MNLKPYLLAAGTLLFFAGSASAQTGNSFWDNWFARSDAAKEEQPHWITPIATTTPRLEQEYRYDENWVLSKPGAAYTENYGNTKGLELIPTSRTEIIIGVPGYAVHNNPAVPNGWGDASLLLKYRILSANEQQGSYILTAFLSSTFPTGTNNTGQSRAIITPTIAYGKGWGPFDMIGTIGAAEPVGNTSIIGRTYTWNHVFQLHPEAKLWPELEINHNWFSGGKNDGKQQTFLTPGVVLGRFHVTNRVGFTAGVGEQIAVSRFHTSNHTFILSLRAPF